MFYQYLRENPLYFFIFFQGKLLEITHIVPTDRLSIITLPKFSPKDVIIRALKPDKNLYFFSPLIGF